MLEKIQLFLKEGMLDDARTLLEDHFRNESLSISERLEVARLLTEVYQKKEDLPSLVKSRIQYAELLFSEKKFEIVIDQIKLVLVTPREKINKSLNILHALSLLWSSYIALGELDNAQEISDWYVDYVLKNKLIDNGIDFIEKLNSYKKRYSRKEVAALAKLYSIRGDFVAVAKLLHLFEGTADERYDVAQYADREMLVGEYHQATIEFIIESYLEKLKNLGKQVVTARMIHKNILNNIYQYIIRYPKGVTGFALIVDYAKTFDIVPLLNSLILYCKEEQELANLVEGLEVSEKNDSEDNDYDLKEIDLGEDLFEETSSNIKVAALERDIKFLMKRGMLEEAKGIAKQLEDFDSENTLLMDLTRLLENREEKPLPRRDLAEVEKDLRGRIAKLMRSDDTEQMDSFAGINTFINYMDDEELKRSYADLLICLHSMECFDAAEKVMNRVDELDLPGNILKDKLAYEYIRIVIYLDSGKLHDALSRCDEIVRLWPLNNDEKATFIYLMAEIYLKQGRRDWALGAFRGVRLLVKNYRMVNARIEELERC